jgi:DNA uptake protein ComE-like DNA-binding protein
MNGPATPDSRGPLSSRASVLVGVLWCMALLAVVVVGALHTSRMDLQVVKNYGDRVQAHYIALAGIEKTKALLYHDATTRRRGAKNHSGDLYNTPRYFQDVKFGRGEFRVVRRGRDDEGGGLVYGVSDEESRLNANLVPTNVLDKLPEITPDKVAAIVDWRDGDNDVTPGGAEQEYYLALRPPRRPRNGPLQTTRELLMVRGVSRELLLGRDTRQNGALDSLPDFAPGAGQPAEPRSPEGPALTDLDLGWASMLTVDSKGDNVNAAGEDRVDLQNADENALRQVKGITPAIAKAIVSSRGQNRLTSVADLLDVKAASGNQGNRGGAQGGQNGPGLVDENLLLDIADDVAVDSGQNQNGVVNINTAGRAVLRCLPGLDDQLAQAIIAFRSSNGYLANTAWLLRVPGVTRDIFKQVSPFVTARSETYRILCEGKVSSTGARQRIQVIVHVGRQSVDTLSYREDL